MDQVTVKTPLIGICISKVKPGLRKLVQERLRQYPGDADIVIFFIKDLYLNRRKVKGTCLKKKSESIHREQGIFRFPDVIYLQSHVNPKVVKNIVEIIGPKIFNSFIFNKWQGWRLLSQDEVLLQHLPDTRKWENEKDLEAFLETYLDIFLKPINLNRHSSQGIVHVIKQEKIKVIYGEGDYIRRSEFDSLPSFLDWITKKVSDPYIMQQGIKTLKRSRNVTDIRLNMNKNGKGEWEPSFLICRAAFNDSHIFPGSVSVLPVSTFDKIFPDNKNIENIEDEIIRLGFHICHTFDQSVHHMADLGIDLAVDQNGHIWILEVNPLPFPLTRLQDLSLTRPLEYAVYLASKFD